MPSQNTSINSRRWWQASSQLESIGLAVLLTVACVIGRLVLDQPNFKPSMAAAILAGAVLSQWRLAMLVPVVSAIITDMILGTYEMPLMISVYACLTLPVFWFRMVQGLATVHVSVGKHGSSWARVRQLAIELGLLNVGAVLAAVVFYVVTSFVVWSATPWYPSGFAGLSQAYWNAIPFLRWMIQGNALFLNALATAWLTYRAVSLWALENDAQPALPQ